MAYNTPLPQKGSDPNPFVSALIAQVMTPDLVDKLKETIAARTSDTDLMTTDSRLSPSESKKEGTIDWRLCSRKFQV